mgnify:FL=1|jgi:hypothetical protein|nr:MAG TPA: hypothetical protein [Caudoviricetes sp.]
MRETIIETIRRITADKRQRGIFPAVATRAEIMAEVQKEVSGELRRLYKQGIIDYTETLNSCAFRLRS